MPSFESSYRIPGDLLDVMCTLLGGCLGILTLLSRQAESCGQPDPEEAGKQPLSGNAGVLIGAVQGETGGQKGRKVRNNTGECCFVI